MAERDPELAEELKLQAAAATALRSGGLPEPQDQADAEYWQGVCNRLERRAGWTMVILGCAMVTGYAVYELLTEPDLHTVYRIGLAAVIVGFGLLLSSVLRQRARTQTNDRYEEIVR